MKIIVIGGTGLLGSKIVNKLRMSGNEAVAASRALGFDTLTGGGLAEMLAGASVVIDVSNSSTFDGTVALQFFETSTRNLLHAETEAGVRHHVAISVVGADRLMKSGYIRAKLAQERLIKEGSVPWSIVRATQFFESIQKLSGMATDGSTVHVPPVFVQPVAGEDVAGFLCDVGVAGPSNATIEVAGPEQFHVEELVRRRLLARHDARRIVIDSRATFFGAPVEERTLLPGADARLGETRLEAWLAASTERAYATMRPPAGARGDGREAEPT